jgi:lipopolysaccharide/colanic/teichoic acid biosynthesis glycosyltransferase
LSETLPTIVPARRGAWPAVKRALDLAGSAVLLVVLSPVLAAIAVAVRLDSKGPALFRQERLGLEGETFRVTKFRSMRVDASDELHRRYIEQLAAGDAAAGDGLKKLTADPRVTRVGAFLRSTSLDELPQLFNVLAGEMSLIGPRPALAYELEHYRPEHFARFSVRPGMTGLWQVSGRANLGFLEMLDLDARYAETGGPATDLRIALMTPRALIGRTA